MENLIVGVVFGGISNENEISVITGTMSANVLKNSGVTVVPIFQDTSGALYTGEELLNLQTFKEESYKKSATALFGLGGVWQCGRRGKPKKFIKLSCVLNCCHGAGGEGGALFGLCKTYSIPVAGASIFESSAFINKYYTKLVLRSLGVKTANYVKVDSIGDIQGAIDKIGFPMIIKPYNLGSSIGVVKAENENQLIDGIDSALCLDDGAICEKYFAERREINCAAYMGVEGVVISECEEPYGFCGIFSYEDKYGGNGKSHFPADIPKTLSEYIKGVTKKVYCALNMRGIVRFDFILSGNTVYLSEINTVPGSLSQYLFSKNYADFANVLIDVINRAIKDFELQAEKTVIKTGILNTFNGNSSKMK